MDIRQLRYFLAIAAERNFSRAAERLNMAQPPLSRQIQQLELEVGAQLFDRDQKPMALTDAGRTRWLAGEPKRQAAICSRGIGSKSLSWSHGKREGTRRCSPGCFIRWGTVRGRLSGRPFRFEPLCNHGDAKACY